PHLRDFPLPAQQRGGLQRAVFAAVIDGIEPVPESFVQLIERKQSLGVEVREKLLAHGTEETLDLAAAFGLIGRRVNDQDADGGGDPRQLWRAIDLGVVHIETSRHTTRGDGLTQAVEEGVEALV